MWRGRARQLAAFVVAASLCVGLVGLAATPGGAGGVGRPRLRVTVYVEGLNIAWDLAFLPDGRAIYTESNAGTISIRASSAETRRVVGTIEALEPVETFDPAGEGGLLGVAVDPQFEANHHIYVCYSTTVDNRVARLTLDYPSATTLSEWQLVLGGIPHSRQGDGSIHNGCRLTFQPRTDPPALFVTIGDARQGTNPQDPNSLSGKVLRIQRDGSPYPGNASGAHWFTRGHRNPQGIAFEPGTGQPYSAEHGPDVDDEVNRLVNGGNAGWDPTELDDDGYEFNAPMTNRALDATAGPVLEAVWSSGNVTVAPSGATFLHGARWKAWDGALVVACLDVERNVGQRLLVLRLRDDGGVASVSSALVRGERLRSAVQGPDGNLYVVTDNTAPARGKILKVVPR